MSGLVFVDTNVLVYARDASETRKQPQAREWMQRLWQERRGRVSTQVLQEYYVVMTEKLKPGLSRLAARDDLRLLQAWQPIPIDRPLLETAWSIEDRFELSFWDALIVAAAQRCNAEYLLSEDLQDGQSFDDVRVLNPFRHEPATI
ncbi:MAG: PIN domain-containing protein [Gemmatimonadota bacterium]